MLVYWEQLEVSEKCWTLVAKETNELLSKAAGGGLIVR